MRPKPSAIVTRERTTDKETDFKAVLTKIKAKNPDVVFHGGMDATGGPMLKQAREADIGIAGGEGKGILFKKGKLVRKVPMDELMDTLIVEVEQLAKEKEAEGNGEVIASSDTNGWESLAPQADRPSTLGREIPVVPHR